MEWKGVKINDEAMRFGLLGGLLHHEEVNFQGASQQAASTLEMKVEASLVDDDGCLREVFRRCSTQGRMGTTVKIINAYSSKIEIKNDEEEKRRGFNLRRK